MTFLTSLAHAWIKIQLSHCIRSGYHWRRRAFIPGEEEIIEKLMEKSHSLDSFANLWAVAADGVSLFYYNATLATWFYGLNLVRFRCTTDSGRYMEIIYANQ